MSYCQQCNRRMTGNGNICTDCDYSNHNQRHFNSIHDAYADIQHKWGGLHDPKFNRYIILFTSLALLLSGIVIAINVKSHVLELTPGGLTYGPFACFILVALFVCCSKSKRNPMRCYCLWFLIPAIVFAALAALFFLELTRIDPIVACYGCPSAPNVTATGLLTCPDFYGNYTYEPLAQKCIKDVSRTCDTINKHDCVPACFCAVASGLCYEYDFLETYHSCNDVTNLDKTTLYSSLLMEAAVVVIGVLFWLLTMFIIFCTKKYTGSNSDLKVPLTKV